MSACPKRNPVKPVPLVSPGESGVIELGIPAALIEKDWYVVQVLLIIAGHTGLAGHVPVFGGGTSLSQRFDFYTYLSTPSARATL